MDYIMNYVREKMKGRTAGIFGTGEKAGVAKAFLEGLGISGYDCFDNDKGKWNEESRILNPARINGDYFILISTVWFGPVKRQLESQGLRELEDYIWALDLEYYDALLRHRNAPAVPEITMNDLQDIENGLEEIADVRRADWFDEAEFMEFEESLGFQETCGKEENGRYRRKIMEYYCARKLLDFPAWGRTDIYVDVGSAGSPFAKRMREMWGIDACGVDLSEGSCSGLPGYFTEDATDMHFLDGEVAGISMQSAYEMFAGDADIRFIREAGRVLKEGGRVVISPLYMHRQYLSTVSPNYYHTGTADDGSLECIRTDCRGNIPIARFYSIGALQERVLKTAVESGLSAIVYALPQEQVEKDGFVYLKFVLCLENTGAAKGKQHRNEERINRE